MTIRFLSFLAGCLILGASGYASWIHAGGDMASGLVIAGMIAGLAAGAVAVPRATGGLRWGLLVALTCAELAAALMTAERTLEARHAKASAVVAEQARLDSLKARVADAKARVEAAEQAVRDQAALKGCRANCRELLQDAVDAARADLADLERTVSDVPAPVEASAFAGWQFAILISALMSVGTNVVGALLVGFACHVSPAPVRKQLEMDWQPLIKVVDEYPATVSRPEPLPPKPRKRRRQFPANVVAFDDHKVVRALRKARKPVSNSELAGLLGETEGEASKSWREVADHLIVGKQGRELRIALRA